ncbi:MAG TPA: hypothetical protein VGL61_19715 [Kofleriaceae bacterium]
MKWLLVACVIVAGCHRDAPSQPEPGSATSTAPAAGTHAPAAQLTAMDGARVELASVLGEHDKTVLVFYRGYY